MSTQTALNFDAPDLARVSSRIGGAVLAFCRERHERRAGLFHMSDLTAYVENTVGIIAPDSAGRVLRDLKKRGALDYRLVSRRDSLYEVLGVEE